MNVFDLMAKISLDKSEYSQGMSEASSEGEQASSKIGGALSKAGKVAGASLVAMGTAVAGVTATIASGVSETASYGDHVDKMSQKIGISAEAYQEWDFIAQHCGTSVDGLQTSMKTLSNAVQSGSEESAEAFSKIGLSMEDVASMSKEDLFNSVISGLQGMEEGTERTALASTLLGRSASELAPLLNQSAEATEEMRQQAHDLGGVMSDEAVKASANYADSLQNLQTAIKGLKNGAFAQFLPAVTSVMDGLTKIFGGDDSGIGQITEGISEFANNLIAQLPKFADFATQILTTIMEAIVENIPMLMDSAIMIVMGLGDAIIQNLPAILTAGLEVILKLAEGISQSLPELIPTIVDVVLQMVDALISNVDLMVDASIALILGLANGLIQAMPVLIEKAPILIEKLVTAFITNVPKLLQASFELVKKLAEGLVTYFPQLLAKIPQLIKDIVEKFKAGFTDFKTVGKNIVDGIWEGLKNGWEWLKGSVKDLATGLLDSAKEALGIHSPSREFRKIGEYCVEGFNEGISDLMDADLMTARIKTGLNSIDVNANVRSSRSQEMAGAYSGQPIVITLQGDAGRLFRLVEAESSRNVQLVGG